MRSPLRQRGILVLAMSLWGLAALMQGLAPALSAFVPEAAESSESASLSPVEAAAIHSKHHRLAICPHHPQGCPAKCLCPKTGFVDDEEPEVGTFSRPARLFDGTAWVECEESRAAVSPVFAVYLPEVQEDWVVTVVSNTVSPEAPAWPRAAALAPPAKVPIV